jgi:hypothetical protein
LGEPLVSQLGHGCTYNFGGRSPYRNKTSALSFATKVDSSDYTQTGGENISPEKQYLTISHSTVVSPLAPNRCDYLKSVRITSLNALYKGLVFVNSP